MIALIGGFLDLLVYVVAFIAVLSVIVFIHEFGHFQVARWCGVRVDVFSIGFGKRLMGWRDRHGTSWQVSALPLGGYVKFFGDASGASTPDARVTASADAGPPGTDAGRSDTESRQSGSRQSGNQGGMTRFLPQEDKEEIASTLSDEEKAVCFHFKPVWVRAAVVLAGPMANFILAIVIFALLFATLGRTVIEPRVGGVVPGSPAEIAGLQTGDLILDVNGRKVSTFNKLSTIIAMSSKETLPILVDRQGALLDLIIEPVREERTDAFGNKVETGFLGIYSFTEPTVTRVIPGGLAAEAGFLPGDRLVSADGVAIRSFGEFIRAALASGSLPLPVEVLRAGSPVDLTLGENLPGGAQITEETWRAELGLVPPSAAIRKTYNPVTAVYAGAVRTGDLIGTTLTYLARLVLGKEDISQMGGPLKIGQYAGQAAKTGFSGSTAETTATLEKIRVSALNLLQLAALISVSIGFLNLLPVPLLDGGHLMYYAYEAAFGKPLNTQLQGAGNVVGAVLLGALMIIVFKNDITHLFFGRV